MFPGLVLSTPVAQRRLLNDERTFLRGALWNFIWCQLGLTQNVDWKFNFVIFSCQYRRILLGLGRSLRARATLMSTCVEFSFFAVFCCEEVQIYRVVYFYCKVKKRKAALLSSNISTVVKILYYTRRWMSAIMAKIHVNPQGFYPKPLSKYF